MCLVSMATSGADEMPRDMEFLMGVNRMNVAVSRAQVLVEVFASTRLLELPCRTVREMALVNALCSLERTGGMVLDELHQADRDGDAAQVGQVDLAMKPFGIVNGHERHSTR